MHRTVTVTGHGVALAVPDRAVVRLRAGHRATTLAAAVSGLAGVSTTLGEVARRHVAAEAVATEGMEVGPAFDHEGRPAGFEATHRLRVGCDDLATASALVSALADEVGDALRVDGVALEVADPSRALAEARERAFADARSRAEQLSALGGRPLGDLLTVEEGQAGSGGATPRHFLVAEVGLEAGQQQVDCWVTATWQLV